MTVNLLFVSFARNSTFIFDKRIILRMYVVGTQHVIKFASFTVVFPSERKHCH